MRHADGIPFVVAALFACAIGAAGPRSDKLDKEFFSFGMVCGKTDGAAGVNLFGNSPSSGMEKAGVPPGKTPIYLAMLAGGVPGTAATRRARKKNHQMAEAYRLYNLLLDAPPDRKTEYVAAFRRGYMLADKTKEYIGGTKKGHPLGHGGAPGKR